MTWDFKISKRRISIAGDLLSVFLLSIRDPGQKKYRQLYVSLLIVLPQQDRGKNRILINQITSDRALSERKFEMLFWILFSYFIAVSGKNLRDFNFSKIES